MSIYDELLSRVGEKRLFRLLPALPRLGVARQMFMSQEINAMLRGPWHASEWEIRCGFLRADLDRFISGGLIPVARGPYKRGKTSYIRQLDPRSDEVWEIRSRDPQPGIRVFGRFAKVDVFVALTWEERAPLKGPGSRQWRNAMVECKADWVNLFPGYQPISGEDIRDYISANTFLV